MRAQHLKREGDGATPQGRFRIRRILYRPDRVRRPISVFRTERLREADGWCDQPGSGSYNRQVRLPFRERSERMWRDDQLYDIVVELDHNFRPRIQGRGSAVFVHLMHPHKSPTQGCVALKPRDLKLLLRALSSIATIEIR